jgi:carbamoyltransferase
MLVLGLSGGLDRVFQHREYLFPPATCHDSAAVLVEDGRVVAAAEEERFNRIKHTAKGAVNAIAHCLRTRGIRLRDVDRVIYYGSEEACDLWMRTLFYGSRDAEPVVTFRQLVHELLQGGLGEDVDDAKLGFVNHHLAHAISTFAQSGFDEGLVVTLDGVGEGMSGSVTRWRGSSYELLAAYPEASSLGIFYDRVIAMLGYAFTEEYKVMGLAPYGDPARFREAFEALYTLSPDGNYVINWHLIPTLYSLAPVRKRGQPFLQDHKDVAAALQEAVERIAFHVLGFFREATGMSRLCLAGGVAHNSTLNGKLLYSGMFDEIFVQPASGDAGCAIGAALCPFLEPPSAEADGEAEADPPRPIRIDHVFWGTDVGGDDAVAAALDRWGAVIRVEREPRIAERCAELLAAGEVIGWVQGKSEFGPRALGHRSIVADPRPAANKDIVNAMVKKREGYRPFAPSVLEEHVHEYFDVPPGSRFPFMSFTLRVRPEFRDVLGATTHVDHTARVQTVSKEAAPEFWALIDAFRERTGIGVVLNTSFNNHAEPIVDSVDDAVVCFLTTGLHRLAVGSHLVSKVGEAPEILCPLYPSLPAYARLTETVAFGPGGQGTVYAMGNSYDRSYVPLSARTHALLRRADGRRTVAELIAEDEGDSGEVAAELWSLWEKRAVLMRPVALTD